ncbi:MAG: 4Fe-4S dicluster domain-containing protein [Candidatus Lokiarchaeota archaeon]|nr:4Fe-4S dicluster domain-containing protein [Candidatus Lokiarchaeota archaeon]
MSGPVVKEIAPKRRRMLDMVMVLGGLKEESAVSLGKVQEEIAQLKNRLSPLIESIESFPAKYFDEFLQSAERMELLEDVEDIGILTQSVSQFDEAISHSDSKVLANFLKLIQNRLQRLQQTTDSETAKDETDISEQLQKIPSLVADVESMVSNLEDIAKAEAVDAEEDLQTIISSLSDIIPNIDKSPDESLSKLQKLGTKTRYGPFLRTVAQLKRGKREGRIDESRFLTLVKKNVLTELYRGIILFILSNMGSKTVVELGELMETPTEDIQYAIVSMIQRGEVEMVGLDHHAPVFSRVLGSVPETTLVLKRIIQQMRAIKKSVKGDDRDLVKSSSEELESLYERLQILGEYDATALSDQMGELRDIVDTCIESAISKQTISDSEDLKLLISAGLEAFARFRLKITLEKGPNLVSGLNVYGEKLDPERYKMIMDSYLDSELERGTLLVLIRELGASSAEDLAKRTGIPQDRVFRHLLRMKKDELLIGAGEEHGYLLYDVPRTPSEAEIALQTVSVIASQLFSAVSELRDLVDELEPRDIGTLANLLETISKARDKLAKVEVKGKIIASNILTEVEDSIKSAVSMTYRTRARIPSTRPKVTLDDLVDVDVPRVLEEYESMMGYAPILGFGTVNWDSSKCLGCKSCEIACPENAIELKPHLQMSKFFEITESQLESLPSTRSLFYKTVRNLAANRSDLDIPLNEESPGFGTVEVDLWLCVACRTCVRRCPGPDEGALDLELKWNLPEVVKQISQKQ